MTTFWRKGDLRNENVKDRCGGPDPSALGHHSRGTAASQGGGRPGKRKMVVENAPIIGVLYFDRVSSLSTEVAGLVKSVRFREGDRVKKRGVLLTLNTDFIDKDIELVETKIEQISVRIQRKWGQALT